jgi:hypothetical protein
MPKDCTDPKVLVPIPFDKDGRNVTPDFSEILTKMQHCYPAQKPISSQIVKNGIVLIPEQTKAIYTGRAFILPGGRVVQPYAANTFDMAKDGAVEVERIKITQPPNKDLEGWIEIHFLGRVCCGL